MGEQAKHMTRAYERMQRRATRKSAKPTRPSILNTLRLLRDLPRIAGKLFSGEYWH